MDATNLTQLSSREQLSALMDGALPADETRFLLRRLRHDASLAESWERWRLSAEVMRGLAPVQRLPADFASRVAASLRDEQEAHGEGQRHVGQDREERLHGATARGFASGTHAMRSSAWLRWGGGAAVAASLAVVALMNQPAVMESPGNLPDATTAAVAFAPAPVPRTPAPQSPAQDPAGIDLESQAAALASAGAVVARPTRNNRRSSQPRVIQATSVLAASTTAVAPVDGGLTSAGNIAPLLPQTDIITRPWPRSALPHNGSSGLSVGFGDNARNAMPYNPFQVRSGIGNLPPTLIVDPPAGDTATPANDGSGGVANSQP